MKRIISAVLCCVLCLTLSSGVFAYNYDFSAGDNTLPGFGNATSSSDPVTPDLMSLNVRRNKDAASLPPPYFYGKMSV